VKTNLVHRILISLLGIAFIFLGTGSLVLGVIGEQTTAVVTDIRREGGERTDIKPGRYTYIISYKFIRQDKVEISGFTRKIGDAIYLKADGTGKIDVRYLKRAPYVNMAEADTMLTWSQPIYVVIGIAFLWLINNKRARSGKANRGGKLRY